MSRFLFFLFLCLCVCVCVFEKSRKLTSPKRKTLQYPRVSMKWFLFVGNFVPGIWKENRRMGKLHCQTQHWTLAHYFWNKIQGQAIGWQVLVLNRFLILQSWMTCMIASYQPLYCLRNHWCHPFFDSASISGCTVSSSLSSAPVSAYPTTFCIALDVSYWSHQISQLHLFSSFLSTS